MSSSAVTDPQKPLERPLLLLALRVMAVTAFVWTVCEITLNAIRGSIYERMWISDVSGDLDAQIATLERLFAWSQIGDIVGPLTILGALLLAGWGASERRTLLKLGLTGAAVLILGALVMASVLLLGGQMERELSGYLWKTKAYLFMGGSVATLLVTSHIAKWRSRGLFLIGYVAHVGLLVWIRGRPTESFESYSTVLKLGSAIDLFGAVMFAGGLLAAAKSLAAVGTAETTTGDGGAVMRRLTRALALRLGLAIGGVVVLVLLIIAKHLEIVPTLIWFLTGFSLIAACYLGYALVCYFSLTSALRSGWAIIIALITLIAAAMVELASAPSATEVFGLIAEAQQATSFWDMPDLSRLEELQTDLVLYRRLALAFGVVSFGAVAVALHRTASGVMSFSAVAKARTLMILIGTGAVGAIACDQILANARKVSPGLVLTGAVVLFCVAIATMIVLFQLLSMLATSLELSDDEEPAQREGPSL